MKSERLAALLAKKAGQSATQEELEELAQLLATDPDAAFMEAVISRVGASDVDAAEKTAFAEVGWDKLASQLEPGTLQVVSRRRRWWAVAATAAILVTATSIGQWLYRTKAREVAAATQHIVAPMGKTIKAILPDGSTVWLNAGSELSYDGGFSITNRNVHVSGEVFLDVVKDEVRPFVAHTADMDIHVLGTSFNIKAYNDDRRAEVSVIGGKVQVVMHSRPDNRVILLPNEKLVMTEPAASNGKAPALSERLNYEVKHLAVSADSSLVVETAWKERKLVFTNETFREVARKMERQFNVTISFKEDSMKNEVLSGGFEKEDIGKALRLLQMITPFHYSINGQHVELYK
ncbi:FecR domain-containing protein [Chitinophaga sp. 212800010-3]|uniref:FecR family protein n=1 Tax=unclassified Chitinophaga TaxID=2619133 RepID=UPI002DE71E81|nr:Ferric-dicitrate binding protein FerR, regulates iron transport through sigma-19 [Chitinophaga sp. 212800010-3]